MGGWEDFKERAPRAACLTVGAGTRPTMTDDTPSWAAT